MKLKTLFIPTIVFLLAGAFSAVSDQRSIEPDEKYLGLDFMVIGESISKEHLRNWKAWKQAVMKCENCALTQPFPDSKEASPLATGSILKSSLNKR